MAIADLLRSVLQMWWSQLDARPYQLRADSGELKALLAELRDNTVTVDLYGDYWR
jgi:hypothetical protein